MKMRLGIKLIIALILIAAGGLVVMREISAACKTTPKVDAHDHGAESNHGEGEHGNEGFGAALCERGLIAALLDGMSQPTTKSTKAAPKSEPPKSEDEHDHAHGGKEHSHESEEGFIKLSAAQIAAAAIDTAPAVSGKLVKEIAVPGRISINANAQVKIVPRLSGTVAQVFKRLGEPVALGDILATIESREIADAKAEYLAASRAEELAKSIFVREERLWRQKVTAEQDYLSAQNGHESAKIKLELTHQKLHAIGLSEDEITALVKLGDESQFRIYEVRSPISGRVTARDIVVGQTVGTDKEVFTVAELSKVWVEMAIPPGDLSFAKEGQEVRVQAGIRMGTAKIVALSPVIDPETRSAKAIAELDNAKGEWQLGEYASAHLLSGELEAKVMVPREAVQTIKGSKIVFVNEGGGFRMRPVTIGREDSVNIEILSGLEIGETVATKNAFTLKAELGKAEAEHEH